MATFQDVLVKALQAGQMKMISVNQQMVEVSRGNKKKAASVKTAITDELADGLMLRKRVAFILHMDADELNQISAEMDKNNLEGVVENAG